MVPPGRVELPLPREIDFESTASASSATGAHMRASYWDYFKLQGNKAKKIPPTELLYGGVGLCSKKFRLLNNPLVVCVREYNWLGHIKSNHFCILDHIHNALLICWAQGCKSWHVL